MDNRDRGSRPSRAPFMAPLSALLFLIAAAIAAPALSPGAARAESRDDFEPRPPIETRRPNLGIMPVAHRGVKALAPENTLPAIEKAIELGYGYVEIDVRYSADGVPLLMHDDWLTRTTGRLGPPSSYQWDKLSELDAGRWFSPEFAGTGIPRVEDALELMRGDINLYLDQKKPPSPELVRLLKDYGFYPDNMVIVGGGPNTRAFLEMEPGAPVMPGLPSADMVDEVLREFPSAVAFNTSCQTLTPEMVEEAHKRGVMVFTNVLNVPPNKRRECMRRPVEYGSDAIQFDHPEVFFPLIGEMRYLAERGDVADSPGDLDFLCREAGDPDAAEDKIFIDCALERGDFAKAPASVGDGGLEVVAYNLERGMHLGRQIGILGGHPDFRDADVILISEADRGCSRTGYKNVTRELARALGMNYVYGVQYIELPRESDDPVNDNDTVCEHGNAVLSRFPIENAELIRHRKTHDWYIPPGPERKNAEPRLGGCITVSTDVITDAGPVRVYSVHLNSDITRETIGNRTDQARELAEHASDAGGPVIMGGDFNTITYTAQLMLGGRPRDQAVAALLAGGMEDAHADIPRRRRGTTGRDYLVRGIIDLIFVRGLEVVESGRCEPKVCGELSDHLPVWTKVRMP